jgi:hypothetical protein
MKISDEFVEPICSLTTDFVLSASQIVIHIRSGDIFESDPHPNYGQPPLIYYVTSLRDIISKKKKELFEGLSVYIITQQDRKNPTIQGIVEWCHKNDVKVTIQSSDIHSDIKYILAAQTLIVGFSTFTKVLILLSKNLRSLYTTFKDVDMSYLTKKTGVFNITVKVYDFPNYSVMKDIWTGSSDQLLSMIEHKEIIEK